MYDFLEQADFNDLSICQDMNIHSNDVFNNSIFLSEEETRNEDILPLITSEIPKINEQLKVPMKRGKKSDDFDYQLFIKKELSKLDTKNLSETAKKKLIQKIRNRISAQRSRNRAKSTLELLKDENSFLRIQNAELTRRVNELVEENSQLNLKVQELQAEKRSHNTMDYEDDKSLGSIELHRTSNPGLPKIKNVLFICLIGTLFLLSKHDTTDKVKMSGVIPLLTKEMPKSNYQLQTLDNYCEAFCTKSQECDSKELKNKIELKDSGYDLYNLNSKQLKIYNDTLEREVVPFMCYESDQPHKVKSHYLLIDKSEAARMDDYDAYYFAPVIRPIRMGITQY